MECTRRVGHIVIKIAAVYLSGNRERSVNEWRSCKWHFLLSKSSALTCARLGLFIPVLVRSCPSVGCSTPVPATPMSMPTILHASVDCSGCRNFKLSVSAVSRYKSAAPYHCRLLCTSVVCSTSVSSVPRQRLYIYIYIYCFILTKDAAAVVLWGERWIRNL